MELIDTGFMLPNKLPMCDNEDSHGLPTQVALEKAMWDGNVEGRAGRDNKQSCYSSVDWKLVNGATGLQRSVTTQTSSQWSIHVVSFIRQFVT